MQNNSKYIRYVILINRQKDYSIDVINMHVEHLKRLDENNQLVLCGPFTDFDGGIVIIEAESIEDAKLISCNYSMPVNNQMTFDAEFSFEVTETKGLKFSGTSY